jgi:hypothetical protein
MGLVGRERRRVVMGRTTEVDVWHVKLRHRRLRRLGPAVASVVFPEPLTRDDDEGRVVPVWLRHLFWNADVRQLNIERDGAYIAARVLASDDAEAHAWAAVTLSPEAFLRAASGRGLEPRRVALARNLAEAR